MKYLKLLNLVLFITLIPFAALNAQCSIEILTVEIDGLCNDDGTYNATLNVESNNATNDFYDLWVNNEFYGFVPIDDLPIALESITPRSNSDFDIVQVCMNDNPDCCAVFEYEQPNCDTDCDFTVYELSTFNCSAVGVYDLRFILNDQEFSGSAFDLYVNSELLYENQPLNTYDPYPINNSTQLIDEITICPTGSTDCCKTIELEAPNCDCNVINEVIFEETICEGGLTYYQINLDYVANGSTTFDLTLGNIFQFLETQTYAYTDLPVIVGPVNEQLYNNNTVIYINDEVGQCSASGSFEFEPCEPTTECTIINAITLNPMCNGNGTYNMNISISQLNPGNDGYSIYVDGELEGSYFYLNTFSLINNLTSDNGESHIIEIVDNEFSGCSYIYEIPPVYCTDCAVTAIEISDVICNDDGTYNAILDASFANATNEFIDVFVNNSFYGFFPITDLPLNLESITPRSNSDFDIVQICMNDNPDCCAVFEYEQPNCDTDAAPCRITELLVETLECNDENMFMISVDLIYDETIEILIGLVGNGENYGTYSTTEFPIEIGPFSANTGVPYELIAYETENETCSIEATFGQNCGEFECYGFENIETGTTFNPENSQPGDLIFELDDITVQSGEFTYLDGTTGYENIEIQDPNIASLTDNALWVSISTIQLGFTNTILPVSQVSLAYWDGGGEVNIGVNGSTPVVLTNFLELAGQAFPDVIITNDNQSGTNYPFYGTLTFMGDIQSITIGGQEFYIDDICVEYDLPPSPPTVSNVWSGDANNDNIVNHFDVLNIGLAYNAEGESRTMEGNDWLAMAAANWNDSFADDTNYKYADCNGNGRVEETDMAAVNENYQLSHGDIPVFESTENNEINPPFFVEMPSANDFVEGQELQIPIILGSEDIPVGQIYGLAFTFRFSEGMFRNNDFEFNFDGGILGDLSEVLTYHQSVFENNQIQVAITRKDQQNVDLTKGTLGYFIGIIDDLAGMTSAEIEIIEVKAINATEERMLFYTPITTIDLSTAAQAVLLDNVVDIFPNPTKDQLFVQNNYQQPMQSIRVLNLIGQTVLETTPNQNNIELNVSEFANGLYFLEINYGNAKNTQKFQVHR